MTCNCPCTFETWIESVRKPLSSLIDWANSCLFEYLNFLLAKVFATYFWRGKNSVLRYFQVFETFLRFSLYGCWLLNSYSRVKSHNLTPGFLYEYCVKRGHWLPHTHTSKLVILVVWQFHNITEDISNQMYGGIQPNWNMKLIHNCFQLDSNFLFINFSIGGRCQVPEFFRTFKIFKKIIKQKANIQCVL